MSSAQCQARMGTQRCARRAAHNYNEGTHHESGTRRWTDDEPNTTPHPSDPITKALNLAEHYLSEAYDKNYAQLIHQRDPEALLIEQARTQHRKNNGA